jgi:regulator of sigma E protease
MTFLLTILSWVGAALAVLIFFGFSIFVHELGHFLSARACGFRIDAFSIGFGKAIWKKKIGATEYKICWIPLGGYVMLPQLDPAGMDKIQGKSGDMEEPLPPVTWWKRIIVSVSGALGNVFFACVLAVVIFFLPQDRLEGLHFDGPVVGFVGEGSGADQAGLRPGDRILAVNDKGVTSWGEFVTETHLSVQDGSVSLSVSNILDNAESEVSVPVGTVKMGLRTMNSITNIYEAHFCGIASIMTNSPAERSGLRSDDVLVSIDGSHVVSIEHAVGMIRASQGVPVTFGIIRSGKHIELEVSPEILPETDGAFGVGVVLGKYDVNVPMWMQYRNPLEQLRSDFKTVGRVLKALVTPKESSKAAGALSGPIMIIPSMWAIMLSGIFSALSFVRFLNMNLAMLNLLPIPVLDGGHVVFAFWRGITGREIPERVVNALVNTFAVLLITAFIILSILDVSVFAKFFNKEEESKSGKTQIEVQTGENEEAGLLPETPVPKDDL